MDSTESPTSPAPVNNEIYIMREEARELFGKKVFGPERRSYIMILSSPKNLTALAAIALGMGDVYQKLRRTGEASIAVAASILLDRTNSEPWMRRADLNESLLDPEAALRFLETFMMQAASATSLRSSARKDP